MILRRYVYVTNANGANGRASVVEEQSGNETNTAEEQPGPSRRRIPRSISPPPQLSRMVPRESDEAPVAKKRAVDLPEEPSSGEPVHHLKRRVMVPKFLAVPPAEPQVLESPPLESSIIAHLDSTSYAKLRDKKPYYVPLEKLMEEYGIPEQFLYESANKEHIVDALKQIQFLRGENKFLETQIMLENRELRFKRETVEELRDDYKRIQLDKNDIVAKTRSLADEIRELRPDLAEMTLEDFLNGVQPQQPLPSTSRKPPANPSQPATKSSLATKSPLPPKASEKKVPRIRQPVFEIRPRRSGRKITATPKAAANRKK
ncbi:unnamed protein product [Caenorhabditis auriculariae]|uniref:Uncharacterized protein n=1 Tax=Caenorhabditis auriculariae TaxID=2777116 RepID=A0A8S1H968_9PELO|nr:unnamed protein product [Caenorhabditis auriculariae]